MRRSYADNGSDANSVVTAVGATGVIAPSGSWRVWDGDRQQAEFVRR
ncbi:MAG TPA: hypothetical protein VHM30_19050 [Gemmatimonadaceae bacterium]|nr:hypothetical protein [Gemmatimonadaceae bacterium]